MSKALATKNVAAVLLGVGMVLSTFAFAIPASAQSTSDLQAQINALLAQIAALQGGSTQQSGGLSCTATFTMNLKQGSTGSEVMALQKFLNSIDGTQVAVSGAGSPGNETSYFGPATKAAVIKFQEKYAADILTPVGLSKGTGNWFASTRAKANALCTTGGNTGTGTGTGTGTTGGTLMVGATAQPANSLAPEGASRVPFTNFTLTNTSNTAVTISGVTVQRTGLAADAVFSGVVLIDSNGQQIGVSRTFGSDHRTTIGENMTIQPGQSMTYTVAGNMAADLDSYSGQVVSLAVVGVNTLSTVSGSLPITGASQTVNSSLAIGTATVGVSTAYDPQTAQRKSIGEAAVRVSGVRVTAGSAEDVKLFSIRWRVNGSAGSSDFSNVMTNINGVAYPTTLSADGRYYTTTIPGGLLIAKGMSVDAYVQIDITGSNASGRTIEFDIDRSSDIYMVGQTYGYGVLPTGINTQAVSTDAAHTSRVTTGQPFFQGAIITVEGSAVTTIGRATEVAAGNIAINVPGQTLGGFVTDLRGEGVTVNTMVFHVATATGAGTGLLTNVTLVDANGAVVAGPVDATYESASVQKVTFNSSITLPVGRKVWTLKGTVPTTAVNGQTFQVSTDPSSSDWTGITGQTTGNTTTFSVSSFTMNTMTVRAAAVNISASTSMTPAATIVAGGQGVNFATIQIDAQQSGEDIRFSSLPIRLIAAAASDDDYLSACQIYNGSTALNTGSNTKNTIIGTTGAGTINTFTFDNPFTVTKGTVVNLTLKCNLSSSAAGSGATYLFGVDAVGDAEYVATGVQSGTTLAETTNITVSDSSSGLQTVGTSAITVTSPSAPSYALASGGTSGVIVNSITLRSSGEDMTLNELALTSAASTAATNDIQRITVWSGTTQVGSVNFTTAGAIATSTITGVTLPKGQDVTLTIKADVSQIGPDQSGTGGNLVDVEFASAKATGQNSGTTVYATGSSSAAGVRIERSFPTVALQSQSSTAISSGRLLRFSISAGSSGPVGIQQLAFQFATSTGLSYSNLNVNVYNTSSFSGVPNGVPNSLFNVAPVAGTSTASNIKFTADNATNGAVQIPAGQTYYFELTGSVSGGTSGSSITTTLLGDSAYARGATSTLDAARNFVWSPNSTTTSSWLSDDFTTGYGLPGLPASGLSQTLTQ